MGRYLGVPLIHGRVTKNLYSSIIDRVQSQLAGWKTSKLSLAGRITLIKSVLAATPTYLMQTTKLPLSIADKLDSIIEGFLWGDTKEKKKMHLVAWQDVCKPKANGGLGFREIRIMNEVVLTKQTWRFMSRPDLFWVQAMNLKYLKNGGDFMSNMKQKICSSTWSGLLQMRSNLQEGIRWRIGNGNGTRFWSDVWVDKNNLLTRAKETLSVTELNFKVSDFFLDDGGWDIAKLNDTLNYKAVHKILGVPRSRQTKFEDELCKSLTKNGEFSVRSCYAMIARFDALEPCPFAWVWKRLGPAKWSPFLWLVCKNKLPTNALRHSRHIAESAVYSRCETEEENVEHVIRRRNKAKWIWEQFVPPEERKNFQDAQWPLWLRQNALWTGTRFGWNTNWSAIFLTTVWCLWRDRCNEVIGGEEVMLTTIRPIFCMASHVDCSRKGSVEEVMNTVIQDMHCIRPKYGTVKVNVDGAAKTTTGVCGMGGLIRDHNGVWLVGFSARLGDTTSLVMELEAIRRGMELTWDEGLRDIDIETDSLEAFNLIMKEEGTLHYCHLIVKDCRTLLN